jgi:hypothetical protein
MKNYFLTTLFLLFYFSAKLQQSDTPKKIFQTNDIGINDKPTITQIYRNYLELQSIPDSLLNHEKKMAERWMRYTFSKFNVYNDNLYSKESYSNAIESIYTSPLNCGNEDPADWQADGPDFMPDWLSPTTNPSSYQQSGGMVKSIYNNPTNLNECLVGTLRSGIFRTTDGGVTWICITDNLSFPVLGVKQIIESPSLPGFLFAITGTEFIKGGVIYSTDYGITWQKVQQNLPQFYWIDFHPTISGMAFAACESEIMFTNNFGLSWQSLGIPNDYSSLHRNFRKIIVFENSFFISSYPWYGGNCQIHSASFSINNNAINASFSSDLAEDYLFPSDLKFCDFSNKENGRMYLEVSNGFTTKIFKTTNSGASFSQVFLTQDITDRGSSDKNVLIASKNNANVFYKGSIFHLRKYDDLTGNFTYIYGNSTNNGYHDDNRCFQILNNNGQDRILIGNDGGAAIVENGLDNLPTMKSLNGNLSISLLHGFDVHEKTGRTVYAFQDHAMRYRDLNLSYSSFFLWEGKAAMVQEDYPDAIVGGNAYSGIQDKLLSLNPIVYSITHGMDDPEILGKPFGNITTCFIKYRHFPERFAAGFGGTTQYSFGKVAMNRAANISEISNISISNSIGEVAICERKPQFIYATEYERGTQEFKLFKSVDDGYNWINLNPMVYLNNSQQNTLSNYLFWNTVTAIAVNPINENIVFLGIGSTYEENSQITDEKFRVIKSTNGGVSFEDYSEGLPALPVEKLLIVESDNQLMFCATSVGVYYRTNEMSRWECFSKNLPKVEITDIEYNYCTNTLYVATYGRGVWKTIVYINTDNSYTEEVISSTIWSDSRHLKNHLLIKSGVTLTITGTILIGKDRKIIVEPGAKLIVDGGTLTTECGEFWKGIEVWGNTNMPQNDGQQGVVELKNSATIENAKYGVRLWKENDWTKTGGILRANNSHFKNVWKGVEYWPYNSYQGQNIELLNKGIIQDCQFTWDDNFYQSQAEAGITMNHVNGVKIYRCSFIDNRTNVSNNEDRPDGITTADAGYRLLGKTVVNQPTIMPDLYFNENLQYCLFKNLNFGIRTYNFASNFTPFIDNCLFENCLHGIELSSVDNAIIVRNKFEFNISRPSSLSSMQQLRLNESASFKIEGNIFNNLFKSKTYGTIAINTGSLNNQIFRNNYNGLYVANYAFGINANSMFNNHYFLGLRGLEYLCNQYIGSQINDQYVYTEPTIPYTGQGIKLIQGNQYLASGNQFSTINNNHELSNFRSTDNEDLRYYHGSVNIEYPQNISSNIIPIQAEENNICESTLASLPNKKSSIVVKLDELNPSIINKKNALNDLLNLHDREELHVLVNQLSHNNKMQVKTILLENSPYLSVEMIKKIAVKTPGIFPNAWLKELIESNIELLNNLELRSFLTNKTNPFPQGMLKQLVTDSKIKVTQRGKKELEINYLEKERNRLINELISIEQEDSVQINWEEVENLNIQLNNPTFYSQNIDIKGSKGNKEEVLEAINAFELYENNFENTQMHEEMLDIKNFKQFYYNKSNPNNGVISLNDTDIQALIQMKEQMKGKAKIQASNMLCFFANICDDFEPVFGTNQKNIEFYQEDNTKLENIQNEVSLYPNPNKGSFVLQCNEKIDTQKLKITSIDGKLIPFNLDEKENNLHYISLTDFKEGVYLIEVHFFSNQKNVIKKIFIY